MQIFLLICRCSPTSPYRVKKYRVTQKYDPKISINLIYSGCNGVGEEGEGLSSEGKELGVKTMGPRPLLSFSSPTYRKLGSVFLRYPVVHCLHPPSLNAARVSYLDSVFPDHQP